VNPEEHILQSWHANANAWSTAIRTQAIESRKLATNEAIINAIVPLRPGHVLDAGCGEGWLCRKLQQFQITTTGIDPIHALIQEAQLQGPGNYMQCSYQDIIQDKFKPSALFDVIVFNFSLFGNELVEDLLQHLHSHLSPQGWLVIQTLHPHTAGGPYQDGWRTGSWKGFSEDFTDPAPWYFRTLESWLDLFNKTGYTLDKLAEPTHPHTQLPVSIIFTCRQKIQ
jgi:2-polyprenyl-3-methyl-5-hydroxy-6-metoxy-1,4-benzoquinol methylase